MASNFYHILEASETASPATLLNLFEQKCKQFQKELEEGSPTAKEQLWLLRQAHETLSNPVKRAAYDKTVKSKEIKITPSEAISQKPEGLSWQLNALLIALLAGGLIGFGLHLGQANKKEENAVKILQIDRSADNDAMRAGTERALVDGAIKNDEKVIDNSAEIANRSLDIEQKTEDRHRQELEYNANAEQKIIEMDSENQKRRLAMEEQQLRDTRQQAEERKLEKNRRYWACMNAMLDKMSSADAGARCANYR